MTTYIDSPDVSAAPQAAVHPVLRPLPFTDLMPNLFALWMLPLSAAQIWTQSFCNLATRREPEEDRDHPSSAQLPVPNPLQQAKDKELFA